MIALWLSVSALADQCAWISSANADAALEHLRPGSEWLSFCEPCGDTSPVKAVVGEATASEVEGGRFREVSVDGQAVDLAYTYVRTPGDPGFTNLAKLVGCPATGVTRHLAWPPTTEHADRLHAWFGTYEHPLARLVIAPCFDDPNGLSVQLDTPTEHPSRAATVVLESYADIDRDPVSFATPFGSCRITVQRTSDGVSLVPDASCAGLMGAIAGPYRRIAP